MYHEKLDKKRLEIAHKTKKPELLTIGMNRKQGFTKLISHYKCNVGIELGVRGALFSEYLVYNTRLYQLHGVDIVDCEDARKLELRTDNYKFHKIDAIEAAKMWPDNWFDFVYIDDNHKYNHVKKELKEWWPKVKPGGILAGDDFMGYFSQVEGLFGVVDAVGEFAAQHKLQIYVIGVPELNHQKLFNLADYVGEQNERHDNHQANFFIEPLQFFMIKV